MAESASGKYPVEALTVVNSIIAQTEADPFYSETIKAGQSQARAEIADAIGLAMRNVAELLDVAATVAYTSSGHSALRMARERPKAPIIGMTPKLATARSLALVWGAHAVLTHDVASVSEMTEFACATAVKEGLAQSGQTIVIAAGMPFGAAGTTNLLRIARLD